MSILGDLTRNRRAYRRYFDQDGEGEQRQSLDLPEQLPEADASARLSGLPASAAESGLYRLADVSGKGLQAPVSDRNAPFSLGWESSGAPDSDEVVERLLSRLEREARLSSQELGEE